MASMVNLCSRLCCEERLEMLCFETCIRFLRILTWAHIVVTQYNFTFFLAQVSSLNFQTICYLFSLSTVFGVDCLSQVLSFYASRGIEVLMLSDTERISIVHHSFLLRIQLCWYKAYSSPVLLVHFCRKFCHVDTQILHKLHKKNQQSGWRIRRMLPRQACSGGKWV